MESNNTFTLNLATKQELLGTTKWAKFLAIIGFIFSGLIVVMAFSVGSIFNNLSTINGGQMPPIPTAGFTVIYLILGLVYFVPSWFLFQFAKRTKLALLNNVEENLTEGVANLRRCFKFMGILTIILLALYALIIIAVAIGMAVGGKMF